MLSTPTILRKVNRLLKQVQSLNCKSLDLSGLKLNEIPREVYGMHWLKEINLCGNPNISIQSLAELQWMPAWAPVVSSEGSRTVSRTVLAAKRSVSRRLVLSRCRTRLSVWCQFNMAPSGVSSVWPRVLSVQSGPVWCQFNMAPSGVSSI